MLNYGDGVSSVNIKELVEFHCSYGNVRTMTAIQTGGRFGALGIDGQLMAYKHSDF